MLAEIILLRLEFAVRTMHEAAPPYARFVPICRGMTFKPVRTRHLSA